MGGDDGAAPGRRNGHAPPGVGPECLQPAEPDLGNGLAEIGFRERISLLAYSPLGFGVLSGKYLRDARAPGRINLFSGFASRYAKPVTAPAVAAYAALADRHGLTSVQLALGFAAGRWCVGSTIIGATTMAQLQENLAAVEVGLSAEILADIECIHLQFPNPAP